MSDANITTPTVTAAVSVGVTATRAATHNHPSRSGLLIVIHGPTSDMLASSLTEGDVRMSSHENKRLLAVMNEEAFRNHTIILSGLLYTISESPSERQVIPTPLLQMLEHADEVYHSGETCCKCTKIASVVDDEFYYCVSCSRQNVNKNKVEKRLIQATVSVSRSNTGLSVTTAIDGIPASSTISIQPDEVTDDRVKSAVADTVKNVREKLPLTFQLYITVYPRIADGIEVDGVEWKRIDRDSMY